MGRRKTRLPEEEAYRQFSKVFDLELLCLELEYNDRIGAMIRTGVEKALDRKQRVFEAVLAAHPATAAEESCRALSRQFDEERLERIAEGRRRRGGARHLARRWHATLAPAHAS
jgi:hypothetical protein